MKRLPVFSPSKGALLFKCAYPFQEGIEWKEWPSSDEQLIGKALHRLAEWQVNDTGPMWPVIGALDEFGLDHIASVQIDAVWGHMQRWIRANPRFDRAEVKLAVNLEKRTARELTEDGDRNYSGCEPGELPMTLDLLDMACAMPTFWDWKTGHTAEGYWGQIGYYALGMAWWTGADLVQGGLLHATSEGIDASRTRVFDRYDVAAIADDLLARLAEVPNSRPNPGLHCAELRCGAFHVCPETAKTVQRVAELAPANDNARALSLEITSADQAAWTLEQLKVYEALAKRVKGAVEAFVGEAKHPLGNGRILEKTYRNVNRLSSDALMSLARAKGATSEEIAACQKPHRESAGIRVRRSHG